MSKFDHLWNDLSFAERKRLAPNQIECQITHLKQSRALMVKGHQRTLAEMDRWIANLERALEKETAA